MTTCDTAAAMALKLPQVSSAEKHSAGALFNQQTHGCDKPALMYCYKQYAVPNVARRMYAAHIA